jgi:hypothetical protein
MGNMRQNQTKRRSQTVNNNPEKQEGEKYATVT